MTFTALRSTLTPKDMLCHRFIIAAAILGNLAVVTTDRRFQDYGIQVIA
jgi:PIN domain nuclease of toxin-antitoxin system